MKIKKRTLKLILFVILVLIIAFFVFKFINKPKYQIEGNKMYYSPDRGDAEYKMSLMNSTGTLDIYSINFMSRPFLGNEAKIYGFLFMPKSKENVPGLVLLPGGGVSKEAEARLASIISEWGYAVLTIDQRGIGETVGNYPGMEQDYSLFLEGNEPIQHLSVYDALKSFDVLSEIKGVDKNNIAIAGESMGARYAIIAAAIEKRFKGVIVISSAGFHVKSSNLASNNYLMSIDPDNYIADISPRDVFMLHGTNDRTVNIKDAEYTFSLAKEPKKFFTAEGCRHGYCDKMEEELRGDIGELFDR
ncbi:MAG: alpha/beta hydrolase [Nanoarchaeota archaeon]|nr:alpha/beta hydrolase [Nanoarchaeota archaeon]MBU1004981.1 alpha/beta hydrolase [Nanoarchaeota archaeon]